MVTFRDELATLAIAALNSGDEPLALIHAMDEVRDLLIGRMVTEAEGPLNPQQEGKERGE